MARKTTKSISGTSFHGTVIKATPSELTTLFPDAYHEQNDGSDKTNFDFYLETESGEPFTLYDWKEYRKLDMNEVVEWHVGGFDEATTITAAREVNNLLK